MKNLITFESCCDYLGIDNTLPVCQIDERQIQSAYKLRVCMMAWNKQDGFEPDETAGYTEEKEGYVPFFDFEGGRLRSSGYANTGATAGIAAATDRPITHFGLRLPLASKKRAVEFGETFIDIFNELI